MTPLLWLYPRRWRRRYGLEMEVLLRHQPPGFRGRLDLIRGAMDARLHPQWAPSMRRRRSVSRPFAGLGALAAVVALGVIVTARSALEIRIFIIAAGAMILGCGVVAVRRRRRRRRGPGPGPEPPEGAPVAARPAPDPPPLVDAIRRRAG